MLMVFREHIYRRHKKPTQCPRCWEVFGNQESLVTHSRGLTVCDLRDEDPVDGLTPEVEKLLRSRKKSSPNQCEEDRWIEIFGWIFPGELVVPLPCKLHRSFNQFLGFERLLNHHES